MASLQTTTKVFPLETTPTNPLDDIKGTQAENPMVFRNDTGPADFIEFGVKSGIFEELPVSKRAKRSLAAFWPFFAAIPNPESLSKDEANFGIKVATAAVEVAMSDVDDAVAALHKFAARTVAARETGQAVGVRFSSQQVPASDAPVEDKKEAVAEDDDDDLDLFGDETEEDKAAAEAREAAKKASAKKNESFFFITSFR